MNTPTEFQSFNPATGKFLDSYPEHSPQKIEKILGQSAQTYQAWRSSKLTTRTITLLSLAEQLHLNREMLAHTMALEMGKPLHEGCAEIDKCSLVCQHYAEYGPQYLQSRSIQTEATHSAVHFQALGPVLAIMPWNFPFWQVFRFAAPAIMAGNTIILKHAPNVSACANAIENIFLNSYAPELLLQNLRVPTRYIKNLLADDRIVAATLTGSTRAGRSLAAAAGQNLKKVVLELGGSDPYLILADADLDLAAQKCARGRLLNNGQSCIAAKRFIVVKDILGEFSEKFLSKMQSYQTGDPLTENQTSSEDTYLLGPLARPDLQKNLHRQIQTSLSMGAHLLKGGQLSESQSGSFYPISVLADVRPGMPVFDEETFGPLAAIIPAEDEAHAIVLSNLSVYGLGSAIFSRDIERAWQIGLQQLETGACFINDFVKSDPRLPFGGIRQSGFGRELSREGILEFTNIKTMQVA